MQGVHRYSRRFAQTLGGRTGFIMLALGALLILPASPVEASDSFKFAKVVKFSPKSLVAKAAGIKATFFTRKKGNRYSLGFSGLAASGADTDQELRTVISADALDLKSSKLVDIRTDQPVYAMKRERKLSILDNKMGDVFVYADKVATTETELAAQHKVVDFLSIFIVAAKYADDNMRQPLNLSMFKDRSMKSVQLTFVKKLPKGGSELKMIDPNAPGGGFTYQIMKTAGGVHYPSLISFKTKNGVIALSGKPR